MRIFLIWTDKGSELEEINLMEALKRHGHEVVYWVGNPNKERYTPPGTIFHSYIDAYHAIPAKNIDYSEFPPPDPNMIDALHKTESVILTMMNLTSDRLCVDERRHIYYSMLQYWLGVFEKYKPEVVIFPNTPHLVYNYLIYQLARRQEIKTIVFYDSRLPGRLLRLDDFEKGCVPLQKELQKAASGEISPVDLPEDIRRYYEGITAKGLSEDPPYIRELKKKHSFYFWLLHEPRIRQSVRDFSIIRKLPRYIVSTAKRRGWAWLYSLAGSVADMIRSNPQKEYHEVARFVPDFSGNFIYFPLQIQPEATTSAHGDIFVDQILAVKMLSFALPSGWEIYVKEHPLQWARIGRGFSSSRYRGYYRRIAEIPGVKLIPANTNSYRLVDQSKVVATITGSAAWEAVLRGKPAVIFGYPWFQDLPGLLRVYSAESCKEAIQTVRRGFSVDQYLVLHYLACLGRVSIRGFCSPISGKYSGLTKQESMQNITQEIVRELAASPNEK